MRLLCADRCLSGGAASYNVGQLAACPACQHTCFRLPLHTCLKLRLHPSTHPVRWWWLGIRPVSRKCFATLLAKGRCEGFVCGGVAEAARVCCVKQGWPAEGGMRAAPCLSCLAACVPTEAQLQVRPQLQPPNHTPCCAAQVCGAVPWRHQRGKAGLLGTTAWHLPA